MPQLSDKKKTKIAEQILYYLFTCAPESQFTSKVAEEIVRDEEFVKDLLKDLYEKKLVVLVSKNAHGKEYQKRQRWRLSNQAYEIYAKRQANLVQRNIHVGSKQDSEH